MERQRSFAIKPTRLLLFSFTIPSSLLFCFLFSTWVLKTTPFASTETHLQFNPGLSTIKALAFAASKTNFSLIGFQNPILGDTHLRKAANFCGEACDWKDKILGGAKVGLSVSFYRGSLDSVKERKNGILRYTHLRKPTNSSENGDSSEIPEKSLLPSVMRIEAKSSVYNDSKERNENFVSKNASSIANGEKIERVSASTCDVSLGKWVFDESYPLYTNNSCPFIDEGFGCEANGRMDKDYMKWRWQPHQCSIPRFNPVKMLELIRGKRLVFVGDSINRNQWESMLCLLRGAISNPKRVYEARGRRITKEKGNYNFKFMDYHCSVEYYVSHFLVHEGKARVGQRRVKTLRIDTMDRSSSRWRGADIIVFNTAHWWSHYKTKSGVNYYQEGDQVHPRLDTSSAFRKALTTWASWVDQHVTPGKTQVFFRSSAPSHFSGGEWNSGGHCKESTRPLDNTVRRSNTEKNLIVEEVVKHMRTPVTILNITSLSGLRIDGHPSIYGRKPRKGSPSGIQDCSHWCLPGVPDTWNELLYFYLLSRQRTLSMN